LGAPLPYRDLLRRALALPLPGARAQRLMAPVPRPGWNPEEDAPAGRPAAVLVLIYPGSADPAEATLVLTERTAALEWHKNQISFPGGRIEPGESPSEAARREAEEELGIPREAPQVLGELSSLWVPATGFTIHPVVAAADERPRFSPNAREVGRVIETSLAHLMRPETVRRARSMMEGRWVAVPYFDLAGARLWGATAMITSELLTLLGWPGPPAARGDHSDISPGE